MKIRFFAEEDDWTTEGEKITDPDKIEALRRTVEVSGRRLSRSIGQRTRALLFSGGRGRSGVRT
jgi:hypothetical protein